MIGTCQTHVSVRCRWGGRPAMPSAPGQLANRLRGKLEDTTAGRSAVVFAVCLRDAIRYRPGGRQSYEDRFSSVTDPYGYKVQPYELGRYENVAAMLDEVRADSLFDRALEIGCHEGAFTQLLAPRCRAVVATDHSRAVLTRAQDQCREWDHVDLRRWDLCLDPMPESFDLVVVMDVLECIHRRGVVRAARDKVVELVAPDGYLLVTNSALNETLEKAWWAGFFLRGGRRINDFVARHPDLRVIQDVDEHGHAITLLRKQAA